jgi:hypothetical protein
MERRRYDFEYSLVARCRGSTGLFYNHGERRGFIEKPQFPLRSRIQKDSTLQKVPVEVRDK